ncbi:MAG: ShlB/FhaC/HecB family hemolysin secretion/activation protein [Gallionella sp.]|nr:ShlB/FhaC/HecB family hemolysin secretion/activation protein [Gallionella sp.]
MKRYLKFIAVFLICSLPMVPVCAEDVPVLPSLAAESQPDVLRFDISGYQVDGASLLSKEEIDAAVAPFVGKSKDFSDVQRALEAVEELYAQRGFSAVHLLLPEQELEKGSVLFQAIEGRFGKIVVKDNQFVSEANVLNALPSVRSGGVPKSKQIAHELKLANENPARQLNVVLKAGEKDDEVDASVLVTDSKPSAWSVTFDNSGSKETGNTRLGVAYRNANLFDADHVGSLQFQTSPEHPNRVMVIGGGYKIPRYQSGDSWEIFGGYSNVNSLVGGLTNFQGGGLMFSARDNWMLDRVAGFDPRLSFGLDWRTFNALKQTQPTTSVLYNEIVATPLSVAIAAIGKVAHGEASFNASIAMNMPLMSKGKKADFARYDPFGILKPDVNYSVLRYGVNYARVVGEDWQLRAAMNGQWSNNVLILGEQMRLGGADGVRGFAEGSEGGENGQRINLEAYSPGKSIWLYEGRALVFYDAGKVSSSNGTSSSIASTGVGLRATSSGQLSLRADMGWILNEGVDPLYRKGDWRIHTSMSLSF